MVQLSRLPVEETEAGRLSDWPKVTDLTLAIIPGLLISDSLRITILSVVQHRSGEGEKTTLPCVYKTLWYVWQRKKTLPR